MLMKNKQMSFSKAQLPAAKATWAAGGPRRQPPACTCGTEQLDRGV